MTQIFIVFKTCIPMPSLFFLLFWISCFVSSCLCVFFNKTQFKPVNSMYFFPTENRLSATPHYRLFYTVDVGVVLFFNSLMMNN